MRKINEVFETRNYLKFKNLEGNRKLNIANLKRLKISMEEEFLQVPIIVNEKHEIIDGQHRFEASKQLGLPVYFIIVRGYKLTHVHKLNAISRNWIFMDYVESFAELGMHEYVLFKQFFNKYKFSASITLAILSNKHYTGGLGETAGNSLKNGTFKVKNYELSCLKAQQIIKVGKFYDGFKRKSFVIALLELLDNPTFDYSVFIQKLALQQTKMVSCTNKEQYIRLIEEIYNYHSRNKVRFI